MVWAPATLVHCPAVPHACPPRLAVIVDAEAGTSDSKNPAIKSLFIRNSLRYICQRSDSNEQIVFQQ
jgi:hypothetical protein